MKRYQSIKLDHVFYPSSMKEDVNGDWVKHQDAVQHAEEVGQYALQLAEDAKHSQFIKIIDDRDHIHLIRKSDVLRLHKYKDEELTYVEIYENSGTMSGKSINLKTKQAIEELHAIL